MKYLFSILLVLVLHFPAFAGTFSGQIQSVTQSDTTLFVFDGTNSLQTTDPELSSLLLDSFKKYQDITIDFLDLDKTITGVHIDTVSDLESKNYSLFIGALSCTAFVLGLGVRI